jgi:hypothetical protein
MEEVTACRHTPAVAFFFQVSLLPQTTHFGCFLGTLFMHTLTFARRQQEAMPHDNYEEGYRAEVGGREGGKESGMHAEHFSFQSKAASTMSPSFKDIRMTKTLAFRG